MIAEGLDLVVGVDTHLDEHVLAIIAAPSGALVAQRSMPAGARGYAAALRFAANRGSGARVWAVEGTGSYGAGLARFLADRGEVVLEISRTPRAERRLRGKDDSLDASRIARAALASETLALPRSGERREALRLLLVARRSAVGVRREALGQLRGVIVTGSRSAGCSSAAAACAAHARQARTSSRRGSCCAASPAGSKQRPSRPPSSSASCSVTCAPALLDEPGVGPIVAAQLIVACSHPGRLRSEAAFARLAGVAPVPASSGKTTRHRLSRGGDRQLNRALHTVVLHRRQHDAGTKDYIARRIAEGKTRRDATRLLKRYLARHLYRVLEQQTPLVT